MGKRHFLTLCDLCSKVCRRKSVIMTCNNCGKPGHNKRTCSTKDYGVTKKDNRKRNAPPLSKPSFRVQGAGEMLPPLLDKKRAASEARLDKDRKRKQPKREEELQRQQELQPQQEAAGIFPLVSPRVSLDPYPNAEKEVDVGAGGDDAKQKPCRRCLTRDSIANAAALVGPAVVNISVHRGLDGIVKQKSMGSGTIIDQDGTILTCAHVVVDSKGLQTLSKGKVEVTLPDRRTFEGTVLNADIHSDIALVKINSKTPLPTANLGCSSSLRPGDWVVAVGCPLSLQNTVTAGIVSYVDRKNSDMGIGGMYREYLQTDCAINPGNSGGPLVNVDGEVIGVNTMKAPAEGLSFAVPVDSVTKIIKDFKKWGRVVRPCLGFQMLDLNTKIIAQLQERVPNFPNVKEGIVVPMVTPGSPGDRAGFLADDVVIKFDGKPVVSIKEVNDIMGDRIGEPIEVVVKRAGDKEVALTVIPQEANIKPLQFH